MNKKGNRVQASVIFLIVGVLLIIIAFLVPAKGFTQNLLLGAAFVPLTVTLLDFFWRLLGGDPTSNALYQLSEVSQETRSELQKTFQLVDNKLQESFKLLEESRAAGVIRLTISGKFPRYEWMDRLKNAQQQVDLMGYTLLTWAKNKNDEEILRLVMRGVKVRILIMDETNPHFSSIINDHLSGTSIDRTRIELKDAQRTFENIKQKIATIKSANPSGSFELRTARKGWIACNICRTDAEMVVVTYMYCQGTSSGPLMVIHHDLEPNLFQAYQEEFDQLWELNA